MRLKKEDFPTVLKTTLDNMKEEKNVIKSGFKASGLVPFNPNAVDYDVLQKKKKSTSISTLNEETITEHQVSNNGNEDVLKQHLQIFENTIPPELLLSFKNALSNESWTGDIEKKALFEYWLQIRQTPFDDSLRVKLIVRSVENLIDFEFKVLGPETIENRRDLISENDIGNFILERVLKVDNITGNSVEENVTVEYIDTSIILSNDIVMGNVLEKENTGVTTNQNSNIPSSKNFAEAFTLPTKYLPKKKRIKVESSGKAKRPAAATSDGWWQNQLQKEEEEKQKQDKISKKKYLQEEKKKIAEEKKA